MGGRGGYGGEHGGGACGGLGGGRVAGRGASAGGVPAGDALEEAAHPALLVLLGAGQQDQLLGARHVVVH